VLGILRAGRRLFGRLPEFVLEADRLALVERDRRSRAASSAAGRSPTARARSLHQLDHEFDGSALQRLVA
jgi:hypothetical protein